MLRFNEFGENGGPAVTELIPKLAVVKKHISSQLGVRIPNIDIFVGCHFTLLAVRFLIQRDEELDSKETAQEEDSQGKSGLGDYLKTVIPSQLVSDRGSNLVVINPGSANIRIGMATQDTPLNIPHCIARYTNQVPKFKVQDQMLNSQVTTAQHMEREKAYDTIASLLKIPFLDEEVANNSFPRKIGRGDGYNPQSGRSVAFPWANVYVQDTDSSLALGTSKNEGIGGESVEKHVGTDAREISSGDCKFRGQIFGEEALRIAPIEPYCISRPIRRGHFNISQHYPLQQVLEDMHAIWDWILTEKLHIPHSERNMYSAILVLPETFDNRAEIKEMLSIALRDLRFSSAVVHQEGLAAVFGNGLSTACIVTMGAQVTSVVCVEDGVALPSTEKTLPFGGEVRILVSPFNSLLNAELTLSWHGDIGINSGKKQRDKDDGILNIPEIGYIKMPSLDPEASSDMAARGELDAVAVVHSYEDGMPAGSHRTRLAALNVPPMGLFYPTLLVPDIYPPPPCSWFLDYENMLEETLHLEYPRRPDMSDGLFPGINVGYPMWESYPIFSSKPKKEEKVGLAEAITSSILSTGKIHIGGVALTAGLIPAVEERVLHAIPSNEAIDTVEVLQSRTNPTFVPWKGGAGGLDSQWDPYSKWQKIQGLLFSSSTSNMLYKLLEGDGKYALI
ncbi:unnamed protein product [Dovyalis caffra]|uniref:Actin-related protein 9 n=1 Tax=Dovyalis caffra TaxID=77055 RepID=A0AAV1QZQ0_9ROSI|nr:unnamed protein product [Dovyalis caffra]